MNLFIDSNIFLDFYHLSGGDIEELKKLVALVESGDITLFACPQIREEIQRNRDSKISYSMKEFKKVNFKLSFPAFCKHYPEYAEIRQKLNDANKIHSELFAKAMQDVESKNLSADSLIADLLNKATEITPTEAMYHAAIKRFRTGNPPGKKKETIGDEMNWESLLIGVPDKEDLHFVSGDGDYCSSLDENTIHSFLDKEWREKKKSDIHFFKSLSDFFEEKFPHIHLATDVVTAGLIDRLSKSGSFVTTHSVISSLSKHSEFSKNQVEELTEIAELNSQVNWIMTDPDVFEFYKGILEKYGDTMSEKSKAKLHSLIYPESSEIPVVSDPQEEHPF